MKAILNFLVPRWMIFGLSFGGDAQTTTTTFQQDNRRVIGQGGISAEGSTVNTSTTTINNDVSGGVVDASLNFAGDAVNSAVNLSGGALKLAGDTTGAALQFGGDVLKANTGLASDAISGLMDTVSRSMSNALTLSQATADNAAQSETMVANAYADAKGRGALTDKILIGALAAVAVVAYAAINKK